LAGVCSAVWEIRDQVKGKKEKKAQWQDKRLSASVGRPNKESFTVKGWGKNFPYFKVSV